MNISELKYLGSLSTGTNEVHDEIMERMNYGNACCYPKHGGSGYV